MLENEFMRSLRRGIVFALLALLGGGVGRATSWYRMTVAPRHQILEGMPSRLTSIEVSQKAQELTDALEDIIPGSTASYYYSVTAGNTYGKSTMDAKADWLTKTSAWLMGRADGLLGTTKRGTAAIENGVEWIDGVVMPEVTVRTEQMAGFQRMLKAYQLFREMEVMAKSWRGSIFKFDVLDVVPVFEQVYLDDFGTPNTGIRVGIKYKDREGKGSVLSAFGMDDPFIGKWDAPRLRYKGPQKFSDIGFSIEASPYQGTDTESGALRIGKKGNEILDRVFFEGVMGRNMADRGVYYTSKAMDDRPSPILLKQRAESARDIRMAQILQEADAYSKAHPELDATAIMNHFKDELEWWRMKPEWLYDNQMARLKRYQDELQKTNNDTVKNESPEKLKEESDPARKNFLDNLFNLYTKIGDSVDNVVNSASGDENQGDNPGPRLLYKANVDYAKATHAAYLEALAIRRYLESRISAEAQRGQAESFYNLWQDAQERQHVLAKFQVRSQEYKERGAKVLGMMDKLGISIDSVHEGVRRMGSTP